MTTLAQTLGDFVAGFAAQDLPGLSLERAKMSLASTLASASAGYGLVSTRIVRKLEKAAGGQPAASLWFDNTLLPVDRAARVNAMASDSAACDDSDMRSIAHIGTTVTATGLAVGQSLQAGGRDILVAMVLGYEVAGRIDEALTPGRMQRGFHGSVATVFAGAVTAGRLMKLDGAHMTQAIAIAATTRIPCPPHNRPTPANAPSATTPAPGPAAAFRDC